MPEPLWFLLGTGGALGSLCRFGLARWFADRSLGVFPWGTFWANLTGAFLLGLLHGSPLSGGWALILGTGFLGGLTTFSTWMVESLRLLEEGEGRTALMNLVGSVLSGVVVYVAGFMLSGGVL